MHSESAQRAFQTTRWSVVRGALGTDDTAARFALASLCDASWCPLYAFFRRSGKNFHDAEDLTQGFFARLVGKDILGSANPEKGRLRSFLLACAQNFLRDAFDRDMAQKRGALLLADFDPAEPEERYVTGRADMLTPDRLFQRQWALAVLDHSLRLLEQEYAVKDQVALLAERRPFLGFGAEPEKRYEEVSIVLGMPIGTLKNKVFRMRERWRELLFEQVGRTLDEPTPDQIKDELSELPGHV